MKAKYLTAPLLVVWAVGVAAVGRGGSGGAGGTGGAAGTGGRGGSGGTGGMGGTTGTGGQAGATACTFPSAHNGNGSFTHYNFAMGTFQENGGYRTACGYFGHAS